MRRPRRQLPAGAAALRLRGPPSPPSEWSPSRMTEDDVLFGYRLQLFDLGARTTVSNACRVFGVHRSTYYRWKHQVDRSGLEMLRPRERRRPVMPNQLPRILEERIVAFSLGHPGLGPRRIAAMLARPNGAGWSFRPTASIRRCDATACPPAPSD